MAGVNLTPNAIEMICNGEFQDDEVKPVVQVSDVKLLSAGQQNSSERYRMILSDGVHLQQGMLATQLNSLVHEGKLQKGSIVQLSQFVSQMIQNRKIIIIIGLNVILEKCDPIGEPKTYVQGGGTANGVPQARPSMPVQSSMDRPVVALPMVAGLTCNAVAMIRNGELLMDGDVKPPVVQIRDLKLLARFKQDDTSERYRVVLSDGIHMDQGMLATQANHLIHEGKLQKGSIIEMPAFICQLIQNRKIIIVIKLNILVEKCDLIGEPQEYTQIGRTSIVQCEKGA